MPEEPGDIEITMDVARKEMLADAVSGGAVHRRIRFAPGDIPIKTPAMAPAK